MQDFTSEVSLNEDSGIISPKKGTRRLVFISLLVGAVCIGVGVLIGYFSRSTACDEPCLKPEDWGKITEDATPGITKKIIDNIDGKNVQKFLKEYTSYPHMAGTPGEEQLAQEMMLEWRQQGLDSVESVTYEILLSYPDKSYPSYIQLIDDNGTEIYMTQLEEKILSEDQNHTDVIPPFNAFSKSGLITDAKLVYVNYGRMEDFKELTTNYSINVNGTIVIARYGQIFRGDKVANAQKFGAVAVILYSDPADYSIGQNVSVYPDSWWLPGTGVQRGTIDYSNNGDPLTPGYPATSTAYRRPEDSAGLPEIPCHPIGYNDAEQFLSLLDGDEVPDSWKGDLNITYRFGPGFAGDAENWTVIMNVTTQNKMVNSSDVFGYIKGEVEPDRYVLLGNHRDAWVFGAIDPTSGTALMMEVSRVLSKLVKEGWRPRRTIVFCSWGAEEHGLVGSYEWVEEYRVNLFHRAVAYLNVDLSVEGQASMRAKGVPILYDFLYNISKQIPSANNPLKTLYEEWLETFPDGNNKEIPKINALGSASDFAAFIGITGVPSVDFRYTHNYSIIDYPLYHSVYETYHLFNTHMEKDESYQYSVAMGRLWGEAARYLADSLVLPLNASQYAETLLVFVADLRKGYGDLMKDNEIELDGLDTAAANFKTIAAYFMGNISLADKKNPLAIRMINDQLMQLERAFIDSEGLPDRRLHKHVLFAPSQFDSYAGATFPGLIDLMWEIDEREPADQKNQWERVRQHLATIIFCTNSATHVITPIQSA